jgi:hypothetical protein
MDSPEIVNIHSADKNAEKIFVNLVCEAFAIYTWLTLMSIICKDNRDKVYKTRILIQLR